jgi:glycosyltransferase involved in cell wall biosynthesis
MKISETCFKPSKILLVSYFCPTRAHAGGLRILDIYYLIKSKIPGIQIDLFTYSRPHMDWDTSELKLIFDNVYYSKTENLTLIGLQEARKDNFIYDVIDLQFHESGYDLDNFRTIGGKIIFTPMESLSRVFFLNLRLALKRTKMDIYQTYIDFKRMIEEIRISRKADNVVCVSKPDASFIQKLTFSNNVCYLESGLSHFEFGDCFEDFDIESELGKKSKTLLYIAFFGSETNRYALKWYLDSVHPLIKQAIPDYCFRVVGRGDISEFFKYQDGNIEFVGEVAHLADQIRTAKVGIAPALNGSGLRGKMSQYAVFGVPSVASPIANKGSRYTIGTDILVSSQPKMFASQCIDLLSDNSLNLKIGQNARATCLKHYSWNSRWDWICQVYNLKLNDEP